MKYLFLLVALILGLPAHGSMRSSANYYIGADTVDSGGLRTSTTLYTNSGSVGNVAGISTVASPSEVIKAGYIAQIYNVTGLTLAATKPTTVNGGATLQLVPQATVDDGSLLALPAGSVAYNVVSGPISSISTTGGVTGEPVSTNTPATVQGVYDTFMATLALTVDAMGVLPPTNISTTGATLNGSIDPSGSATTAYFQYGLSTAYGETTATTALGSGSSYVPFSDTLTGLMPGTYHYQLVTVSGGVSTDYADETFTIAGIPDITETPVMPPMMLVLCGAAILVAAIYALPASRTTARRLEAPI